MKMALVCGAGGFIGSHLVNRLKEEGGSGGLVLSPVGSNAQNDGSVLFIHGLVPFRTSTLGTP